MKAVKQGVKLSGVAQLPVKQKDRSASVENKHWVASQLLSMLMIFNEYYYFIHGEILAHFHTYLICIYTAFKF